MIDPEKEQLMIRNLARRLPWMKGRFGNDLSIATMDRYCRPPGLRGVILETIRLGGTIYTSREATLRFVTRLNESDRPTRTRNRVRGSQIEAAERVLKDAGI